MAYDNPEDDPQFQAVALLTSIDATLKAMLKLAQDRRPKVKEIATDRDLDGPRGNPKVTFNPRDWTGPSFKGLTMADCPAEFLDLLADTLDYFGDQAEAKHEEYNGKATAPYKRRDAARARGWAKRIRDGKHTPAAVGAPSDGWAGGFE